MDTAVKTGRFEEAAALSDTLSQREVSHTRVVKYCELTITKTPFSKVL